MLKSLSIARERKAKPKTFLWAAVRARFSACSGVAVKCLFQQHSLSFHAASTSQESQRMWCILKCFASQMGFIFIQDNFADWQVSVWCWNWTCTRALHFICSITPVHELLGFHVGIFPLLSNIWHEQNDSSDISCNKFVPKRIEHYYTILYTWVPQPSTLIWPEIVSV